MFDAAKYLAEETLKDSSKVTIRAIHPDDKDRLVKAFLALEPQTHSLALLLREAEPYCR